MVLSDEINLYSTTDKQITQYNICVWHLLRWSVKINGGERQRSRDEKWLECLKIK
jgi:hypothetical protein